MYWIKIFDISVSPRLYFTVFSISTIEGCIGSFKYIRKLHWSWLVVFSFIEFLSQVTSKLIIWSFYMNCQYLRRIRINSLSRKLTMLLLSFLVIVLSIFSYFLVVFICEFWPINFCIISTWRFQTWHCDILSFQFFCIN